MIDIPLSTINALPFDFDTSVGAYIKSLRDHQDTEGQPAPSAHPLVVAAVERQQHPIEAGKPDDFVRAYRVIDDSPTLEQRKLALANEVTTEGDRRIMEVVPPLKSALWAMEHGEAAAVKVADRKPEHKAAISRFEQKSAKVQAIRRHVAQMHSDIHDLTAETIDGWKAAPFPT